jgi:hypothetical protein
MGLFKNKQEEMELPPPPPPEEGEALMFPEIPQEEEMHIPSEMPMINAAEAPRPSFPLTGAPIQPAMPRAKEMPAMETGTSMPSDVPYVDISNFHEIMTNVGKIRDTLKESEDRVNRMAEIKNIEEKELEKWRSQLEDIERKLSFVDQVISKGE